MASDSSPLAEEAAVANARRLVNREGGRHRPELAKVLLDLSHAYERRDRLEDALAAARESAVTLSPDFLANPQSLATAMRAVIAQYVALAQRSRVQPDTALLAPIAAALGGVMRAEDSDDDTDR